MPVIIHPWRRGTRTRLYVQDSATRENIGWIDPDQHTGQLHDPERAVEYVAALFKHGVPREVTIRVVAQANTPDRDLACNEPGEAAQAKADELTRGMSPDHQQIVRSLGYGSVEQTWAQGAEGERLVGGKLDSQLPAPWKVLHSVPVGGEGSDIDHLVIGPSGVFSINTKNHPGSRVVCAENKVRVEGGKLTKNHPYARNSRFEAKRASRILSKACGMDVDVQGVVVYIALELAVLSQPKDGKVTHVSSEHVIGWLRGREECVSVRAVERIYERARRSGTWGEG